MNDENILKTVKWMPLDYFYKFRLLTITHKAFYNVDLEKINSLVVKSPNSYNFRKSLNINVNKPKTKLGRRTFSHRTATAWVILAHQISKQAHSPIFLIVLFETDIGREHFRRVLEKLYYNLFFPRNRPNRRLP